MFLTKIVLHFAYSATPVSDNYMTVKSNGGLNQMRTGVRILFILSFVKLAYQSAPILEPLLHDASDLSDEAF